MNSKLESLIKKCSGILKECVDENFNCSDCDCSEKECLYSLLAIMMETDYDSIEEYMSHYWDK
jgi:hypothetical protein